MTNLCEDSGMVKFIQDSKAAHFLQFSYKILHSLGILWGKNHNSAQIGGDVYGKSFMAYLQIDETYGRSFTE